MSRNSRRNILCVVEFDSYPEQVVARAAWLAKLHDCALELLVCDPVTDFLGESYVYLLETQLIVNTIRAAQDETLAALAESAEDMGVAVTVKVSNDRNVAEAIRDEARARNPMFVVKGTHCHTPSERASMAGTDWQLIRDLHSPLWFVKPQDWKDPPIVVAAVDPTHSSDTSAMLDRAIVKMGQAITENCGGTLRLVHCYERLEEIGSRVTWAFKPRKLPVEEMDEKIRKEHTRALNILAETCGVDPASTHLLPGRAHELLPSFAREQGASLVIMGALARSKLKYRIVGSTAARSLDHINCDVLVAHVNQGT